MRKYSVQEIDELRTLCWKKCTFGTFLPLPNMIGYPSHNKSYDEVEEMVRTYMLGGITAKDILKIKNKKHKKLS